MFTVEVNSVPSYRLEISNSSVSNCPLSCMYYFHINAWYCGLYFIQIHIGSPPSVWVSLPRECLLLYFLFYPLFSCVCKQKHFWAPRQSMMIKQHARSITLKRSNIPYKCISHRRDSRNEEIHFWSQWPHVFSLLTERRKNKKTRQQS